MLEIMKIVLISMSSKSLEKLTIIILLMNIIIVVDCVLCLPPVVLNCVRLLTRVIPFLLEDSNWRMIFWAPANMTLATTGPGEGGGSASSSPSLSLGQMLLNSVGDLLFCPDFTVMGKKKKNQPVGVFMN